MLKRIKKLIGYGVFRDFSWSNQEPFNKYNAIYGFNGSGKSTLCRVIKSLNAGSLLEKESGSLVMLEMENFTTELKEGSPLREVLIYDQDFIGENFKWGEGISPFVVIGKKSQEEEEKYNALQARNKELDQQINELNSTVSSLITQIALKGTSSAGELKRELLSINPTKYGTTYNKTHFERELNGPRRLALTSFSKTKDDLANLRVQIYQEALSTIENAVPSLNYFESVIDEALSFLEAESPVKQIVEFSQKQILWLEEGLNLHLDKNECLFCSSTITAGRKELIEKQIHNEVSNFIRTGEDLVSKLQNLQPPVITCKKESLYQEFQDDFHIKLQLVEAVALEATSISGKISSAISSKVRFQDVQNTVRGEMAPVMEKLSTALNEMQSLVNQHNTKTIGLAQIKNNAVLEIENIYLKEYLVQTTQFELDKATHGSTITALNGEKDNNKKEIDKISSNLQSEAKAILAINNMLHLFLGRNDISLNFNPTKLKFEVQRRGGAAKRLSEGEKTAISVCYFLILLNSDLEKKLNTIVVIDDPITSLDSVNIYNAYSVMKENLREVKQLFIFTHSMIYFRLVIRMLADFKSSCNYVIETTSNRDSPDTTIKTLAKLTKETSTEYILLYTHLKKFVENVDKGIEFTDSDFLPFPNMLRKLLEAYLYAKEPGKVANDYEASLIKYGMNPEVAKKADRFCNDFSHARFDSLYGPEIESLGSTPTIIKSVIEELEKIDQMHFSSMKLA